MAQHAILSASGSHRWLHCTPSAVLEKDIKDTGSDYAREGTLAHAFCAKALKEHLGKPTKGEELEIEELQYDYLTDEMPAHVETYVDIVLEKYEQARQKTRDAVLMVESRLDFSQWVPQGFGTGDAIIVADGLLEICDFKYGKGVEVSAVANSQMMIYALGAYAAYSDEYTIDRVRMTIIQPRINNLSEYELSVSDLLKWAKEILVPTAQKAIKGEGEQMAGEWCQFCKVKTMCKALAKHCTEDFDAFEAASDKSELLTPDDIVKLLPKLDTIKKWVSEMSDYALQQALNGQQYQGYKVVEGRSIRKITDDEKAAEILRGQGLDETAIYKPKALKGLTDLEGIVGKKKLAEVLKEVIVKPQGKPTLVPDTDKRPALNAAVDDFKNLD